MKSELEKIADKVKKAMGEADFMVITHKDGKCCAMIEGERTNISQAMFCCMFNENDEASDILYRILKVNVLNLLKNPSPYAIDLADSILDILPSSFYVQSEKLQQEAN